MLLAIGATAKADYCLRSKQLLKLEVRATHTNCFLALLYLWLGSMLASGTGC